MANKIYVAPTSGPYLGKLLVFDHVESMAHVRTSKIPQHPVESLNRSVADHRFRDGARITLTGMFSDNWNSSIVSNPLPDFKTSVSKKQITLREKMEEEFPRGTIVNKVVNEILDKKTPDPVQLERAKEEDTRWIGQSERILEEEKDALDRATEKQLATTGGQANDSFNNTFINTIQEAKEILNHLDQTSTICSVISLHENYTNMVLQTFTNVLRNGEQRGAYWVNLTFEEQLIASVATKEVIVDAKDSEEAETKSEKGETNPLSVDERDALRRRITLFWDEEIKKFSIKDPDIETKASEQVGGETLAKREQDRIFRQTVNMGADIDAAIINAQQATAGAVRNISAGG